jgi:hypothetical protein
LYVTAASCALIAYSLAPSTTISLLLGQSLPSSGPVTSHGLVQSPLKFTRIAFALSLRDSRMMSGTLPVRLRSRLVRERRCTALARPFGWLRYRSLLLLHFGPSFIPETKPKPYIQESQGF